MRPPVVFFVKLRRCKDGEREGEKERSRVSFWSLYVRECICSRARRGDFETKKRKKKKKKTRSFVRSFALVRRRELTKHRRGERKATKIWRPKKKRGANSKKFSPRRRSDTFLSFSVLTLALGGAFLAFTTPARAEREEERIKFCQSFCFGKKF